MKWIKAAQRRRVNTKANNKMRLLTHNMLQCPRTKHYPLGLVITTCDDTQVTYSASFIRRMLRRINWEVFLTAARQLPDEEMLALLPDEIIDGGEGLSDEVLRAVHRGLLEWHVVDGELHAAEHSVYTVRDGIPNLVITEVRAKESESENVAA